MTPRYTSEQLAALRLERHKTKLPAEHPSAKANSRGYTYYRKRLPTPTIAALERIQRLYLTDDAWAGLRMQAETLGYHTPTTRTKQAHGVGAYLTACAPLPPRHWDDTRPDDITSRYDDPDTGRICWNPPIAPLPDTPDATPQPHKRGPRPRASTRAALTLSRRPHDLSLEPAACDALRQIAAFWAIAPLRKGGDPLAQVVEMIGRGWLSPLRPYTVLPKRAPGVNATMERLGILTYDWHTGKSKRRGRPPTDKGTRPGYINLPNY